MPPPLSEAWATAYVQILITLVVFALGIPALAVQLIVQDDIREVFHRRMRVTGWIASLAIIILTFIAFVWILHPPFKKAKTPTNNQTEVGKDIVISIPLTVATPAETDANMAPNNPVIAVGRATIANPATEEEDEYFLMWSLAASVVMTVIPLILITLGYMQITYLRRQNIVKELENELLGDYLEDRPPKKRWRSLLTILRDSFFKKKRKNRKSVVSRPEQQEADNLVEDTLPPLREDTLHDLIYLGQHGKPGRDKKFVFDVFDRIAATVQSAEKYQGGELEDLISGLKDILLNNNQPGDDEDFNYAIEILKSIRTRLSQKEKTSKYLDAGLTISVLEELGIEAVKSKSVRTAERFLDEAVSSETIFKMGLIALDNKQFHTATLALNRLESLAEDKGLPACPETFALLGLIAHFIMSGTSARMRADDFLSENLQTFKPSITACLAGAHEHHYLSSNFDTADKIFTLSQEIKTQRWRPLLLASVYN